VERKAEQITNSSSPSMLLNGFRLELSSERFPVWLEDMPDNKAMRSLRNRLTDEWFLSWRDGVLYGIPKVSDATLPFGQKNYLICADHLSLIAARIDSVLPDKFPQYKAFRARPFTFLGQKNEIVSLVAAEMPRVSPSSEVFLFDRAFA
jgi:hypothetical protein